MCGKICPKIAKTVARKALNRGLNDHHFKDDSCYAASGKYCACIEFHLSEDKRRGFHTSQLID